MPKTILRIMAVLLIHALAIDPSTAAMLSNGTILPGLDVCRDGSQAYFTVEAVDEPNMHFFWPALGPAHQVAKIESSARATRRSFLRAAAGGLGLAARLSWSQENPESIYRPQKGDPEWQRAQKVGRQLVAFIDSRLPLMKRPIDNPVLSFLRMLRADIPHMEWVIFSESDARPIDMEWYFEERFLQPKWARVHVMADYQKLEEFLEAARTDSFAADALALVLMRAGGSLYGIRANQDLFSELSELEAAFHGYDPAKDSPDLPLSLAAHSVEMERWIDMPIMAYLERNRSTPDTLETQAGKVANENLRMQLLYFANLLKAVQGKEGFDRDEAIRLMLFVHSVAPANLELGSAALNIFFPEAVQKGWIIIDSQGNVTDYKRLPFLNDPKYVQGTRGISEPIPRVFIGLFGGMIVLAIIVAVIRLWHWHQHGGDSGEDGGTGATGDEDLGPQGSGHSARELPFQRLRLESV